MIKKLIPIFVILILLSSCERKSGKKNIEGKVISILDGDTYDALIQGNKTIRVRMEGIDAPERGMPFYNVSKKYLSELCFGKQVNIKITGTDHYNRILAYTYLEDGRELSHEMVKAGLAWHYKKYNSEKTLADLETAARELKTGIWSHKNPMAPWDNRRYHRQGISTKDSFNIFR